MFLMEILFIDLENTTPVTLSGWPVEWPIYLFYGKTQEKIKIDLAQSLQIRQDKVNWIKMDGDGKNALDFHISFYLGQLSLQHPKSSFKILSKDKGFDPLMKHLKQQSIDCERIEKAPSKSASKETAAKQTASGKNRDWPTLLSEFSAHLASMAEAKRPKKIAKLKAFFKSHCAIEGDSRAEEMILFLKSNNRIQLDGEKMIYTSTTI
jgi:PIN domain